MGQHFLILILSVAALHNNYENNMLVFCYHQKMSQKMRKRTVAQASFFDQVIYKFVSVGPPTSL